jgi:single stranded DNA-binding protein
MSDMNQVALSGRLTRDPIVRGEGDRLAVTLSIASNRQWPDGAGGFNEEVCFIDVSTFSFVAQRCVGRLKKGALVWVSGRLQLNRWQDAASGENRQAVRIVASNVDSPSFRANRTEPQTETLEQAALRAAAELTDSERADRDDVALTQNAAEMPEAVPTTA